MDREQARRFMDDLRTRAYVRNMVSEQLEERDRVSQEGEPVITFSVRLPITEVAHLQLIGSYLGHKKTPFASMLLQAALEDAFYGLEEAERENGRLDEFYEHMEQLVEVEGGTVDLSRRRNRLNGEGEVG